MADLTTAFWGMTINNYTETDLALVQNAYPDHMRELVFTLEQGADGTPHIQAWIKLKRQQRMSFVKKLFPRGHFKALCSAEYQQNTKLYAQKLDGTAQSPAVHRFNDPIHTIEGIARKVINRMIELDYPLNKRPFVEHEMVQEDYSMAKVFVSATYKQMFKQFGESMYECLAIQHLERKDALEEIQNSVLENDDEAPPEADTHTHAHTYVDKVERISIPLIDADDIQEEASEEGDEEEDDDSSVGPESSSGSEGSDSECSGEDAEEEY